jgi:isocitrate lyase
LQTACTRHGPIKSKLPHEAEVPHLFQALIRSSRLAYNLSPSFNWKAAMAPEEQETYIERLGKLGYCWQFITLAGLHTTALITDQFAKAYAKHGMRAYGELVQEQEMERKIDIVTHQKWSGANYVDNLLKMVTGGISSTSAMGNGVTEDQFK